ncbi:MAG: AAA family ATPase [Cytophagales bacterium]|nr:AAA family ATPase [Cytophagales bacterium]
MSQFPIGIQDFGEIIRSRWAYVDKTAHIHRLVSSGKYYFLSRPRRFGKSLLVSPSKRFFWKQGFVL